MTDYKYLRKVKNRLNQYGLEDLTFEKLNYGINTSAWHICSGNKNFFLKFYISQKNDKRDRLGTELKFTKLLENGGFKNIPKILISNKNENWALFEWLDGEKIKNPNQKDLEDIINFIKKIQTLKKFEESKKIGEASEACFNLIDHKNLIINRLNQLINYSGILGKSWLIFEVLESINKCVNNFQSYFSSNSSKSLSLQKRILSPSDIGIHNILKIKNQLYFHDFEYAGWDDPHKLIVDLLIQPENVLSKETSLKLYKSMESFFSLEANLHSLKIYLVLYRAKWVCIILKKFLSNNLSLSDKQNLLTKSMDYYKKVGFIWDL